MDNWLENIGAKVSGALSLSGTAPVDKRAQVNKSLLHLQDALANILEAVYGKEFFVHFQCHYAEPAGQSVRKLSGLTLRIDCQSGADYSSPVICANVECYVIHPLKMLLGDQVCQELICGDYKPVCDYDGKLRWYSIPLSVDAMIKWEKEIIAFQKRTTPEREIGSLMSGLQIRSYLGVVGILNKLCNEVLEIKRYLLHFGTDANHRRIELQIGINGLPHEFPEFDQIKIYWNFIQPLEEYCADKKVHLDWGLKGASVYITLDCTSPEQLQEISRKLCRNIPSKLSDEKEKRLHQLENPQQNPFVEKRERQQLEKQGINTTELPGRENAELSGLLNEQLRKVPAGVDISRLTLNQCQQMLVSSLPAPCQKGMVPYVLPMVFLNNIVSLCIDMEKYVVHVVPWHPDSKENQQGKFTAVALNMSRKDGLFFKEDDRSVLRFNTVSELRCQLGWASCLDLFHTSYGAGDSVFFIGFRLDGLTESTKALHDLSIKMAKEPEQQRKARLLERRNQAHKIQQQVHEIHRFLANHKQLKNHADPGFVGCLKLIAEIRIQYEHANIADDSYKQAIDANSFGSHDQRAVVLDKNDLLIFIESHPRFRNNLMDYFKHADHLLKCCTQLIENAVNPKDKKAFIRLRNTLTVAFECINELQQRKTQQAAAEVVD